MASLYPYQEQVWKYLKAGKNVILQAPTGAGKTRAALYPFLENLELYSDKELPADAPLPLTCRYAVPMRVLATQFEREYRERLARMDQRRATRLADLYTKKLGVVVPSIQTGETPDDPKFESPLTFCTIDQLLASFIGTPYSVGSKQANLNVGAVIGSYLILDEFHLYPLDKHGSGARMTTLAMLRLLKGLSPFVMMTATFSTRLLDRLAKLLDAEVVRVKDAQEVAEIMQGRARIIRQAEEAMTPEAILGAHRLAQERHAGASLVVCNTVARAQEMYLRLREALGEDQASKKLLLLHSRFTPEDRQRKSQELEDRLGEKNRLGEKLWEGGQFHGPDTIVVGTQVVEVGLNISAGVLHTELAPANSLIQRAGRCARFAQQQGEVIVYPIPPREDGKIAYQPYDDDLCEQTWKHLGAMIARGGEPVQPSGFKEEQELIDAVHTQEDEQMLARFAANETRTRDTIMQVLASHDRGKIGTLIRNITQVSVVIHNEPEKAMTTKPFRWISFGLHPRTLQKYWKNLEERKAALGDKAPSWIMRQLVPGGDFPEDEQDDNTREPIYDWDIIKAVEIPSALRLALPRELATYDSDLGFRLLVRADEPVGEWQSEKIRRDPPSRNQKGGGKQESYVSHITGLMRAYRWSIRNELAWLAIRLEEKMSLSPGSIDHAVRLAIACHDIGKLSKGWQAWAQAWQKLLAKERWGMYEFLPGNEFLAKTDRLPKQEEERKLQKQRPIKRPNHAYEGVLASNELIAESLINSFGASPEKSLDALIRATLNAIARHHTPSLSSHDAVTWADSIETPIREALVICGISPDLRGLDLQPKSRGDVEKDYLIQPSDKTDLDLLATWLGFVVVRTLRLCDQRAEKELS